MSRIFYIMGKSSSGKDTILKKLLATFPSFKQLVTYTTRPMRQGEKNGVEYFFTDYATYRRLQQEGRIIESRCYETIQGHWIYYTVDDGQIWEGNEDYLYIGTIESYEKLKTFFGNRVIPLYIEVDDGIRLARALERERREAVPRYEEMCRRYLADSHDFSEEKLQNAGIKKRFCNNKLNICLDEIIRYITEVM